MRSCDNKAIATTQLCALRTCSRSRETKVRSLHFKGRYFQTFCIGVQTQSKTLSVLHFVCVCLCLCLRGGGGGESFKGWKPVLEGFVVTMHEGARETGSQTRGRLAEGFDVLFAKAWVHCDNKPDRSVLITIITWHFQFHPLNISILHLKYEYRARSESSARGGARNRKSNPRPLGRGIWRPFCKSPSALWQQTTTDRS